MTAEQRARLEAQLAAMTAERDAAREDVKDAASAVRLWEQLEAAEARATEAEAKVREAEAENARLRKHLDWAAPHICPECGPHSRVDECGCCAVCGADTYFASDPYAAEEL